MYKLIVFILLVLVMLIDPVSAEMQPSDPQPQTVTCFRKGEVVDGRYKICYYSCMGSTVAITVKSYQLCPITIQQ